MYLSKNVGLLSTVEVFLDRFLNETHLINELPPAISCLDETNQTCISSHLLSVLETLPTSLYGFKNVVHYVSTGAFLRRWWHQFTIYSLWIEVTSKMRESGSRWRPTNEVGPVRICRRRRWREVQNGWCLSFYLRGPEAVVGEMDKHKSVVYFDP